MSFKVNTDSSTLALAPMVRMFTYAVIKTMKNKNLSDRKNILHADMVPRLSENIIQASMGERTTQYSEKMTPSISDNKPTMAIPSPAPELIQEEKKESPVQNIPLQNDFNEMPSMMQPPAPKPQIQSAPLMQPPKANIPQNIPTRNLPRNPPIQGPGQMMSPLPQAMAPPESPAGEELSQFYGKITPLLNDPSITVIECSGTGRPVMVVRMGQKQPSKIVLNEKEIKQVLDKVSESAHIPLLEGVFRAAVDTFTINAVISEMIGSRFIIKKQPMAPPQMAPPGMGGFPGPR